MVDYNIDSLTPIFQALANPTRREIVTLLTRVERTTILEIAAHFQMSLNGISKHIKVLEAAGILLRQISGRTHYCSLRSEPFEQADAWITYHRQFWGTRLDALEQVLEAKKQHNK